jgi:hypothetical protein
MSVDNPRPGIVFLKPAAAGGPEAAAEGRIIQQGL